MLIDLTDVNLRNAISVGWEDGKCVVRSENMTLRLSPEIAEAIMLIDGEPVDQNPEDF